MEKNKPDITPKTKIAELLEAYPELEDVLIGLAPEFAKLKNPLLRRTIAKVATLGQAAAVGNVGLDILINELRSHAGQDKAEDLAGNDWTIGQPEWFDRSMVAKTFDARQVISQGGHPLTQVQQDVSKMEKGSIYELVTPFLPAPLIDIMKDKGHDTWPLKETESLFRIFIRVN